MNKNLIKEVESLISDVDKTHRYSMSKIYDLSNRVFGTNETPQSCSSCLIRKVNELKKWVQAEKDKESKMSREVGNYEEALNKEITDKAKVKNKKNKEV